MSIYKEVYDFFIYKLGNPTSKEALEEYIYFVIDNQTSKAINENYCEDHHIIPRNIKENNLVFTLEYKDHVKAHLLLAEAYPIQMFTITLNFMLNRDEKKDKNYSKLHSVAVSKSWEKFRLTAKYQQWLEKQKINGKREENINHITKMTPKAQEYMSDPILNDIRISKIKESWTPEKRKQKSENLIEYNLIHGTQRYTDAMNYRWQTMSDEKYKEFCETMSIVNKDEEKRKKAGQKIKDKWENSEDYKNKMRIRPKRGPGTAKDKESANNPESKMKKLLSRKVFHIRKNIPKEMLPLLENLSKEEIADQYSIYTSRYWNQKKTPNNELNKRLEVLIIKKYKEKFKIRGCRITDKGWYRLSITNLKNIIIIYSNKYGIIQEYETEIRRILNETN